MENGTTYMVRPAMQPSNRGFKSARISAGAFQLLVGPAFSSFSQQMKVRSSTRATSEGSEQAKKLLARLAGLSFLKVPASTSCWHSASYSACEPSHQCTLAGLHKATISLTQAISWGFFTKSGACTCRALGAAAFIDVSGIVKSGDDRLHAETLSTVFCFSLWFDLPHFSAAGGHSRQAS